MSTHKVSILCPAAQAPVIRKVLARIFGDPPDSNNLSVSVCSAQDDPYTGTITHYCNHILRTEAEANALLNLRLGVLPTFNDGLSWSDFGVTLTEVNAAIVLISPHVTTDDALPTTFVDGFLSALGLQRKQHEI
jgi:hypothetical protein